MPSPAAFARILFGVVATLHYGPIVQAQPTVPPPTQYRDAIRLLDYWLEAQTAFDRVPAVSAGVVIGQELVWSRGYGFVDKNGKIPAGSDTIYSVCSISKLFTSIAILPALYPSSNKPSIWIQRCTTLSAAPNSPTRRSPSRIA